MKIIGNAQVKQYVMHLSVFNVCRGAYSLQCYLFFFTGCACHLMHLAAGKAADQHPVKVVELLVDIYYYLEKSSKRKQKFRVCQERADVPKHKIVNKSLPGSCH